MIVWKTCPKANLLRRLNSASAICGESSGRKDLSLVSLPVKVLVTGSFDLFGGGGPHNDRVCVCV